MGGDEVYDGIPVPELTFSEVDVPDASHLQRSRRYSGALDIQPLAAIEAAMDASALVARDPNSATGEAIRTIGYSPTAGRVLVVVLIPDRHPPDGRWHVATAWPANPQQRQIYNNSDEERTDDKPES